MATASSREWPITVIAVIGSATPPAAVSVGFIAGGALILIFHQWWREFWDAVVPVRVDHTISRNSFDIALPIVLIVVGVSTLIERLAG